MDNTIGNINVTIDLTKLPGARVMDITRGETTHKCVVLPIDNEMGIICDGYEAKTPEGLPTIKSYSEVKLFMVGIAQREMKFGSSHGLKPALGPKYLEKMTEEQLRAVAYCGNVKPWMLPKKKEQQKPEESNPKYKNW